MKSLYVVTIIVVNLLGYSPPEVYNSAIVVDDVHQCAQRASAWAKALEEDIHAQQAFEYKVFGTCLEIEDTRHL